MRLRPLRGLVAVVTSLITTAAVIGVVILLAIERLPSLLVMGAARLAPDYRFDVDAARLDGLEHLALTHVRVYARASDDLIFTAKHVSIRFSPGALRAGHLAEVRVFAPLLLVPEALPPADTAASESSPTPAWTLDRLVVRGGRLHMRRHAGRPGLRLRFTTDLRDLGLTGARGERAHRLRLRDLRATLADGPSSLVVRDALATVRPGAVLERQTIDEVRLFGVMLTVPGMSPGAGSDTPVPGLRWRVDRLVTRSARVDVHPSVDQPGVALVLAFDLRELGLTPPLNERLHRVGIRNLRAKLADRPPSLIVDTARAEFTLGDLLGRQRLARLAIDGGMLVMDAALRARLMAPSAGGTSVPASSASLGTLEVRGLGLRITELAEEIPDVTLTFATTLREVPFSREALALARDPQHVELADLRLYSPLDPFRQVAHVGSVFIDFTLANLVRQRIDALTLLSPTIYLGEDLIWYMNMARREGATATAAVPEAWTVGRVRADLGRVVVTFNGADRLNLPITFRSQARNVALAEMASLHLSADLEVPRQSYTFPGFDLQLVDMEGRLHFDYPRGEARDNVVNVLEVGEMRWRDYRVTKGWLAVTFDEGGINGKLGGQAYEGYVDGGLSIPFGAGPPWSGWMAGTKLDLAPIAAVVAGSRVEMTGIADVSAALDLRAGRPERAEGRLTLDGPGRVRFPDLETMLERLPADTSPLQRDLARIVVEALREQTYTGGEGTLAYADARGEARLTLDGGRGARRFEVHYYEDEARVPEVPR